MLLSDFDYELPKELIAQHPPPQRGQSRLLVIPKAGGPLQHRMFTDLPEYLKPGDCLVLNDTKVIPARLIGQRATGGRVELLLLRQISDREWEALAKPARRLRPHERLIFSEELTAEIVAMGSEGRRIVRLDYEGDFWAVLERAGQTPLPPYIRRKKPEPQDRERYQTVYAAVPGAVAAPTAGLHFTPELLQEMERKGIRIARLTLHVGLGTFRPIQTENIENHRMHAEYYSVSERAAAIINETRAQQGRIVAVGTTVVRTLETIVDENERVRPGSGMTDLYITPGFVFRATDALITNFHLPRSSLLVLVAAFVGRERILEAYQEAIRRGYRFYSYGDATLII